MVNVVVIACVWVGCVCLMGCCLCCFNYCLGCCSHGLFDLRFVWVAFLLRGGFRLLWCTCAGCGFATALVCWVYELLIYWLSVFPFTNAEACFDYGYFVGLLFWNCEMWFGCCWLICLWFCWLLLVSYLHWLVNCWSF